MSQKEIEYLDDVIVKINKQLGIFAEITEQMAKWTDSEFKQKSFDKIFAQQDFFAKESKKIFERLEQLGVYPK